MTEKIESNKIAKPPKAILFEALGWYGSLALIVAFALNSYEVIDSQSMSYQLLNFTGAAGIIAISLYKRVYQPAVLNIFWLMIAAIALVTIVGENI